MYNTLFRNLLMQGVGEIPTSGWEYADYFEAKSVTQGIQLAWRISQTGTTVIEFQIPDSITSNDNIFLLTKPYIKVYYNNNVLTVDILSSSGVTATTLTSTDSSDSKVHRLVINNGYVYLDTTKSSSQVITSQQGAHPVLAQGFTSGCKLYNVSFFTADIGYSIVYRKSLKAVCISSGYVSSGVFFSSQKNINYAVELDNNWQGHFDYEPEYVDYITPAEDIKIKDLWVTDYPSPKFDITINNPSDVSGFFYQAGNRVEEDNHNAGQVFLSKAGDTQLRYMQRGSVGYCFFDNMSFSTPLQFSNYDNVFKIRNTTTLPSSTTAAGYTDYSSNPDEWGEIQMYHTIYNGVQISKFKITNNDNTTYDTLPCKKHYECAFPDNGFLFDTETGYRLEYRGATVESRAISYYKPPFDANFVPIVIQPINRSACIPTGIYINDFSTGSVSTYFSGESLKTNNSEYHNMVWTLSLPYKPGSTSFWQGMTVYSRGYYQYIRGGSTTYKSTVGEGSHQCYVELSSWNNKGLSGSQLMLFNPDTNYSVSWNASGVGSSYLTSLYVVTDGVRYNLYFLKDPATDKLYLKIESTSNTRFVEIENPEYFAYVEFNKGVPVNPNGKLFYIEDVSGSANTVTLDNSMYFNTSLYHKVQYSFDAINWTTVTVGRDYTSPKINLPANGRVYLKMISAGQDYTNYSKYPYIKSTGDIRACGDLSSYTGGYKNLMYQWSEMFANCTTITDVSGMFITQTVLGKLYFWGCSKLSAIRYDGNYSDPSTTYGSLPTTGKFYKPRNYNVTAPTGWTVINL